MTVEPQETSEASAGNAGGAVELYERRPESESTQGSSLTPDAVDRYGLESFPASDPPSWWAGDPAPRAHLSSRAAASADTGSI